MFSEKYRYYCLLITTDLSGKPVHRLLPTHNSCDTAVRCQRCCRLSSLRVLLSCSTTWRLRAVTRDLRYLLRVPATLRCSEILSLHSLSATSITCGHILTRTYVLPFTDYGILTTLHPQNQSSSKRTDIILPTERHSVSKSWPSG